MTKKFISLLMLVVMVVGLIPAMSASAEVTIVKNDRFETYTVKSFNTDYSASKTLPTIYDTGSSSTYNVYWSLGKDLALNIVEMIGYDGEVTNAAEIIVNSCGGFSNNTPGSVRFQHSSTAYSTACVYVQEMDVYITDNPLTCDMYPIMISNNSIGFGSSHDKGKYEYYPLEKGWHRIKAVTLIGAEGANVIGYIDGECVQYKEHTRTSITAQFQIYGKNFPNFKSIIFDNIKLWRNPDATTASSVYSDASNVAVNKNLTVDFSQELLDTKIDSVDTISTANVAMTKSDGTPVNFALTVSSDKKSIVIDPADNLEKGMQYNVTVTGLKDIYDAEIADCEFSFTTVEESKISCAQPTFKKENLFAYANQGTTLSALENGYISADLAVANRDVAEKEVFVLAVLKENGNIKSFHFDAVTVPAQGSAPFSCGFQVDDAANQTIETFVWDSFSGKTPLASKWTLSNSGCTETIIEEQ